MAVKLKDNNFYARLQEKQAGAAEAKPGAHVSVPALVLCGICAVSFVVLFAANLVQQSRLNATLGWIADPANVEQYTQAVTKQSMLTALNAKQSKVDNAWAALASYPQMQENVLTRIEFAGGADVALTVNSYDATTGILQFEASSPQVLDIPDYIRKLEATTLFHSVVYSGYGYNSTQQTYEINVSCVMRAADGEE